MTQPIVSTLYYTGMESDDPLYAARLLVFTKSTRLQMTPDGFGTILAMNESGIRSHLDYMAKTIPSSWEFVDFTFMIQNVSRACAQQITRTRTASFAMQSQRVTEMKGVTWHVPASVKGEPSYTHMMEQALDNYAFLVEKGESLEDARGVLPINVHCNLVAKYNLRSLVDLLRARDSMRVQGEYQSVARQMKEQVLAAWPWSAPFFEPNDKKAIEIIEEVAAQLTSEHRTALAKAADLIKKG